VAEAAAVAELLFFAWDCEAGRLPRKVPPKREVAAWNADVALGAAVEVVFAAAPPVADVPAAPLELLEPEELEAVAVPVDEEVDALEAVLFRPLRLPRSSGASRE